MSQLVRHNTGQVENQPAESYNQVHGRSCHKGGKMKITAVISLLFLALLSWGRAHPGQEKLSPAYHLYIGFTATSECVPEDGPYLTQLSLDAAFRDLRFGFGRKKAGPEPMSWWLAAGPRSTLPIYVVFGEGMITAHELCPHTQCDGKIVKAWFTAENTSFTGVLAVVADSDVAGRDDIVNEKLSRDLDQALVPIPRYIFECKLPLMETLAWTDDCAVRHQEDVVGGMEFCFALPAAGLLQGKPLTYEFPFRHGDIDAPGTLTVRFIPVK